MRITTAVRATVLALLILASCGQAEDPSQPGTDAASPQIDENVVDVGLTEYSFDMPDDVTGGTVTFQATNTGGLPHEVAFGSIEGDRDLDDVMKALESQKEPDWFKDIAGIPVLSPGVRASMTRELDEGGYVFLCFLPTPQGKPHAFEGMVKFFTVSGTSDAPAPAADLTITATDDGFEVPEITAGTHTIELVNDGTKPHEFAFFSLAPGKTEKDIDKWFGGGLQGEPPAIFPGGMQSIDPGISIIVEMTLEPGRTYSLQDFENQLEEKIVVE